MIERNLPNNLEAERAVLGGIITNNEAFHLINTKISESSFFRQAHRFIFRTIADALDKPDSAVDLVTLKNALDRKGLLDEVGGASYVSALLDGVPKSINVEHYAEIVREASMYRETIFAVNKTLAQAYDAEKPATLIVTELEGRLNELQSGLLEGRMSDLKDVGRTLIAEIEYRSAHRGELTGSETGFPSINELTSGWQLGDMNIIAARPSIGKTTFAINSAVAAARAGKRVVYFSMEMTRKQLEFRLLASIANVKLTAIIGGYIMGQEWAKLSDAIGTMADLPFVIDDTPGITPREMRSKIRRRRGMDGAVDLVVVDYVQIMGSHLKANTSKRERIADNALLLQQLAKEERFSLMLLSQLSRKGQDRADPRPQLSDLRDAGELEEYADLVAFLHRKHHREGGVTNFIIEKQRNGPTGTVNLTLDRDVTLFVDGGEEKPPTPEELAAEEERKKETKRRSIRKRVAHIGS